MVTFKESLANDCEAVFFNADEFANSFALKRGQWSATSAVCGIIVSREYETPTSDQLLTDVRTLDVDIQATAYVIGGAEALPQRGDRLTDETSGDVYEVLPLTGRQCYELTGDGLVYRVHVKQVK